MAQLGNTDSYLMIFDDPRGGTRVGHGGQGACVESTFVLI